MSTEVKLSRKEKIAAAILGSWAAICIAAFVIRSIESDFPAFMGGVIFGIILTAIVFIGVMMNDS